MFEPFWTAVICLGNLQGKKALPEEIGLACECERASEATVTVEAGALDFPEMEGHGYDRFGDGERDTYQIDYRRTVGDMQPSRPRLSLRD